MRVVLLFSLLFSINAFSKFTQVNSEALRKDPSLISVKYEANPCFKEPSKSLSRSPGFFLMKDGSVVTSRHTRFSGPFTSIPDFMKKLDVCTYNHGKMGSGKKDYRVIHDDYLFSPEITKFVSGGGGSFDGGGASAIWIGVDEEAGASRVVVSKATK